MHAYYYSRADRTTTVRCGHVAAFVLGSSSLDNVYNRGGSRLPRENQRCEAAATWPFRRDVRQRRTKTGAIPAGARAGPWPARGIALANTLAGLEGYFLAHLRADRRRPVAGCRGGGGLLRPAGDISCDNRLCVPLWAICEPFRPSVAISLW